MKNYRITFGYDGGQARSRIYTGESECEAIENWDYDFEYSEYEYEILSVVELEE